MWPSFHAPPTSKLPERGEGANVNFDVNAEMFSAHKCLLAARSPYFRAQFFGLMREPEEPCAIDKVQFSCTVLAEKLLWVADQYLIDLLKIICKDILHKDISDENITQFLDQCSYQMHQERNP